MTRLSAPPTSRRVGAIVEDESGCWLWQRAIAENGYGRAWKDGRMVAAHRALYEELVGPIPEGLDLDHLCRVRHCVNPNHLEPVTRGENVRRGIAPQVRTALNASRTHCKHGHEMTSENTRVVTRDGYVFRICRACKREDAARRAPERKPPRTHCRKGHLFDEANTLLNRNSYRTCRACAAERNVRFRSKKMLRDIEARLEAPFEVNA